MSLAERKIVNWQIATWTMLVLFIMALVLVFYFAFRKILYSIRSDKALCSGHGYTTVGDGPEYCTCDSGYSGLGCET